jgi:hypothetical protein
MVLGRIHDCIYGAGGPDLRHTPLGERKAKLHSIVRKTLERLLYCEHVEGEGGERPLAYSSELSPSGFTLKLEVSVLLSLESANEPPSQSSWQGGELRDRKLAPRVRLDYLHVTKLPKSGLP